MSNKIEEIATKIPATIKYHGINSLQLVFVGFIYVCYLFFSGLKFTFEDTNFTTIEYTRKTDEYSSHVTALLLKIILFRFVNDNSEH